MNQDIQQLRNQVEAITGKDNCELSLLAELRTLLPAQLLSEKQAKGVAERMAQRMRLRLDLEEDFPFPNSAIESQPRIEVSTHPELRDLSGQVQSGLSGWDPKRRLWVIALNGSEYPLRQRFSLMHEFCHVILSPLTKSPETIEKFLPSVGTYTSTERLENMCDSFSACLLMPRPLMKRAWSAGHQDVRGLSRLFGVSKMAIRHRLHDIGLVEPVRRHRPYFGNSLYFRTPANDASAPSFANARLGETALPRSN